MTDDLPEVSLLSLYHDDTMRVICHWHHMPTESEIADMIRSLTEQELFEIKGVLIAKTIAFHGDAAH